MFVAYADEVMNERACVDRGAWRCGGSHQYAATAQAHDWINRDAFLCCGSKDCTPIDPAKVTPRSGGYYLQSYKETVPYSEVLPSQDRLYWRCSTCRSLLLRCVCAGLRDLCVLCRTAS